ncbi:hypothetical protein BCR32DRAFT_270056 [Anaeromyces robustus]|uniref:Peptidase S8/S53 domain-containing protein n=1 Tax=Anaeromyces robustus TaxID=1754192 RepID=A0A1Y1WYC1_9FUNG|nr:hypothetical protein BCR32DRAFT_270056 [Anaeromyces robustus]|eukprot:ORX78493.1 hypothetical protein BCR32DRAFT_270056 [Anaeromyces robustus]
MKNYYFLLTIVILFNYFIGVYSENANYIVNILRKETDKTFDDEKPEIQLKIEELVNDRMNDIYDVIEENKESYVLENGEQDQKLEELETNPLRKRGDKKFKYKFFNPRSKYNHSKRSVENEDTEYIPIKSKLINHVCPINNYYAINVYLSDDIVETVCHLPNVISCEKSFNYELYDNVHKEDFDYEIIRKKINETDVSEQYIDFYPNFLEAICNDDVIGYEYNPTFRYPVSAGKGIDIYIIDDGFITYHDDFDTYEGTEDERTVACDAISSIDEIILTDEETKNSCFGVFDEEDNAYVEPYHGVGVSSVAAGKIYGVAKKANIHDIASDLSHISVLRAFDFIMLNGKPHKTVINISLGSTTFYHKSVDDKLAELIKNGFIIFVGAGNDNKNCCASKDSEEFFAFTGYRKAIAVGSASTNYGSVGYTKEEFSNYGDCVDIFAPGDVVMASFYYGTIDSKEEYSIHESGTSFSSPIAAGVAASIMSENPEYEFDNESMRKVLIGLANKGSIKGLKADSNTPRRFINNGKNKIITSSSLDNDENKCGINSSGKKIICDEGCCSKEGKCISIFSDQVEKCLIENGCQSDYGFCTTKENSIAECEIEIENNKECLFEISTELNDEDFLYCENYDRNGCTSFFGSLNDPWETNRINICSIARNFKDFGFINTMDIAKYYKYDDICREDIQTKYKKLCENEASDYKKCFIDNEVLNIYSKYRSRELDSLKDNEIQSLRKACIDFKSDYCVDFRSRKNQIVLTYPSCELFRHSSYYNMDQIFYEEMRRIKDRGNDFMNFCERFIEYQESKCDNILEEYDECLPIFTTTNTTTIGEEEEELIMKNCSIFKSEKCQSFYENKYNLIPLCHNYTMTMKYEKSELLINFEDTVNNYKNICDNVEFNDEMKEKIISDCKNELQNNECLFDYDPKMKDEDIASYCELFRSEKCNKEYTFSNGVCKLAQTYYNNNNKNNNNNTDTEIVSMLNEYERKYSINYHLCKMSKEEVIEKCETNLDDYYDCTLLKEDSPDDIYYNCLYYFNDDACQKFYEDPYKDFPECLVAERYQSFNIFSKNDIKWEYYNENCPKIIEAGYNLLNEPSPTNNDFDINSTTTTITDIDSTPTLFV